VTSDNGGDDLQVPDDGDLRIPDDPARDQHDARLLTLVQWYTPDTTAPIADAFPHMPPEDRAEALNIIGRLGNALKDT
jgi:hypothetical protein